MADVLRWGFLPSCKLHYASLQEVHVRYDYFCQEVEHHPNNLWRVVVLKSNSTVRGFYDAPSLEAAKRLAERAARGVVLDANFNDRELPYAITPSIG